MVLVITHFAVLFIAHVKQLIIETIMKMMFKNSNLSTVQHVLLLLILVVSTS